MSKEKETPDVQKPKGKVFDVNDAASKTDDTDAAAPVKGKAFQVNDPDP